MAQDDFSLLAGAVERAESGGRRYDRSGNLLTSPKGAQGEMQVMPRTQRSPGFGVEPAKPGDPEDIARVGRDYLKAMLDRYGNREHALVAYNWGPGKADKWIASGADPAKLPKETQDYVSRVSRFMGQPAAQPAVSRETKQQLDEAPDRAMQETLSRNPSAKAAPAVPVAAAEKLAELGPSYQAAFALAALADADAEERKDRDVDDDREPSVAQKWLMDYSSRPSALAELAMSSIASPFAPLKMAGGGDVDISSAYAVDGVGRFANGGWAVQGLPGVSYPSAAAPVAAAAPSAAPAPSVAAIEAIRPIEAAGGDSSTPGPGGQGGPSTIGGGIAALGQALSGVPSSPAAAMGITSPVAATAVNALSPVATVAMAVANTVATAINSSIAQQESQAAQNAAITAVSEQAAINAASNPANAASNQAEVDAIAAAIDADSATQGGQDATASVGAEGHGNPDLADGGFVTKKADGGEVQEPNVFKVPLYSETVSYEMYPGQEGQFDQRDAARHMLASGTLARKYGSTAAEMLGKLHEITTSPMRYLGSKIGISEMPVDYEQDLHNNRVGIELGKRSKSQKELEDLVQQMAEQAQRSRTEGKPWVGRPERPVKRSNGSPITGEQADLTRPMTYNPMIRRQGEAARRLAALRDVNTLPDPRTYAAVSGFLGAAPDELGFSVMHPDLAGIKAAGERGFAAGTVAQVAPMGAAIRGLGSGAKTTAQQMLAGMQDIPVGMAIKPKGGTFMPSRIPEGDFQGSGLANTLDRYLEVAKRENMPPEVMEFLQTKAPKYFTTTYGTGDDPLRTAIRKRQIEPFGTDQTRMPPYMVDAALDKEARGSAQARRDLERFYDQSTGISARALMPDAAGNTERFRTATQMQEQLRQKMAMEGVPNEFISNMSIDTFSPSMFSQYPSSTRSLSELVQMRQQGTLPPELGRALDTGEMIYDISPTMQLLYPNHVIEALAQVPANKLKNMSFVDALIEGNKKLEPIRNYQSAIAMAERGASVPKQALAQFTKPVLPLEEKQWVQLTDPLASEMEGKLMKHSVGGYSRGDTYNQADTGLPVGGKSAFDQGLVRLYSLRGEDGLPSVTVEIAKAQAGKSDKWNVIQVRGKFNSDPLNHEEVFKLFDKLDKDVGLEQIRRNSYIRSNTGEEIPGTVVNWGEEFNNWKAGTE